MTNEPKVTRRLGGREATIAIIPGDYAISVGNPETPLPDGWQWHLLTDLARLESGHTPSRKHPEYWGGETPWIGIKDATANHGRTIYSTNENTNELGIANSAARVLPKNTVCLSRTASVGFVVVMGRPMATSQDFVNWSCGPALDYRYLKYALIAEGDALLRFADGSVHQTIYFPEVKSLHLAAPSYPEQSAIADILSALDDKIELNLQMNEALEASSQAIFKDWFVNFGPVRRKRDGATEPVAVFGGLPLDAKSAASIATHFPDSFGDHGLPEGWSFQRIDNLFELAYGKSLPASRRNSGTVPVYGSGGINGTHDVPLVSGPGIIIGRKGTVGSRYWEHDGFFPIDTVFYVQPHKKISFEYIWELLPSLGLEDMNTDAAVPGLNRSNVYQLEIPKAPGELVDAFTSLVAPLRLLVEHNKKENKALAQIRDFLLPKLISGEVRVRNIEHVAE